MSGEVTSHVEAETVDWLSWWGDVDFFNEESGVVEYHFGPVAHVMHAGGRGHRYQALTVAELNQQIAHLGIKIEWPADQINQAACACRRCTEYGGERVPATNR